VFVCVHLEKTFHYSQWFLFFGTDPNQCHITVDARFLEVAVARVWNRLPRGIIALNTSVFSHSFDSLCLSVNYATL